MSRKHGGFSLTELMVAIALLATATAGGVGAVSQARSAQRSAAHQQQLHERAQYVLATLEPELEMAGYFGPADQRPDAAREVPESAAACGVETVSRLDVAFEVLGSWTLPCEARGGGAVPGSDVLIVRRAAAHLSSAPEAGRAQWLAGVGATPAGLYWDGTAPWLRADAAAGIELRDLLVNIYYIARAADGERESHALRVKALSRIAGTPTFIDTEVMPGVESMQIQKVPTSGPARAARMRLRFTADAHRSGGADHLPAVLEVARTFPLRNARN